MNTTPKWTRPTQSPRVNTTNHKQLERVALYDFVHRRVKGNCTVLSILIQSQFFLQRRRRETQKGEELTLSSFPLPWKRNSSGCYNYSSSFLLFVEGWPLLQSTSAPYRPLPETHREGEWLNLSKLSYPENFADKEISKFWNYASTFDSLKGSL